MQWTSRGMPRLQVGLWLALVFLRKQQRHGPGIWRQARHGVRDWRAEEGSWEG